MDFSGREALRSNSIHAAQRSFGCDGWNYFNDKAAGRKPRGFKVNVARLVSKTLYSFLAGATLLLTSFPRSPLLSRPLLQEGQSAAECCS
jgi:antibiotic biosynthesis monooxygenase (ABM) superfamily enzyme